MISNAPLEELWAFPFFGSFCWCSLSLCREVALPCMWRGISEATQGASGGSGLLLLLLLLLALMLVLPLMLLVLPKEIFVSELSLNSLDTAAASSMLSESSSKLLVISSPAMTLLGSFDLAPSSSVGPGRTKTSSNWRDPSLP